MQDPIQPISASVISIDDREEFFAIEKFSNNDTFLVASNKRIVILRYMENGVVEPVDNLCFFPTDPLVSMSLKCNTAFCLQERGVSVVELSTTKTSDMLPRAVESDNSGVDDNMFSTDPNPHPFVPPLPIQPISRSPIKKQTFEVPPTIPVFKDLEEMPGSSDSTKRISLPFDVGRVKRIYGDVANDRILFGGEILNIMINSQGGYKINEDRVHLSFFSVVSTHSGYILLNDWVTNDLMVIDNNYREVNRYSGVPDLRKLEATSMKYIHQSSDCLLWLAGSGRVIRIHYDLSMEDVKLFDADFIDRFNPYIYIVQGSGKDKFFTVALLDEKGHCLVVSDSTATHVVPLTNLGSDSRFLSPSEGHRLYVRR